MNKKNIFAIIGSASENSSNQRLVEYIAELTKDYFHVTVFNVLKTLPHFDPALSIANTPDQVLAFRDSIEAADAILICTPEYVFSIPSGLKNSLEWCVSTTVFADKPTGLITASASGKKGHEELKLIMRTVMARFTEVTTLLIQGIKGKIDEEGNIVDESTHTDLVNFVDAFKSLVLNTEI